MACALTEVPRSRLGYIMCRAHRKMQYEAPYSSLKIVKAVTAEHIAKGGALLSMAAELLCVCTGGTLTTQVLPRPSLSSRRRHSRCHLNTPPLLGAPDNPMPTYLPNSLLAPCVPCLVFQANQTTQISKILKLSQPTARNTHSLMKFYLLFKA